MATRFVETTVPVGCTWCKSRLRILSGVRNLHRKEPAIVVLCPRCDDLTLTLARKRVVAFGHLEERDGGLVWAADPLGSTASKSQRL